MIIDQILICADRLDFLKQIPNNTARLVVTSPPYNIGKSYEQKMSFEDYLQEQKNTIQECYRILADNGSLCWQVGNYVNNGEILPLDIPIYSICREFNMKLRNRIIWHFEHGLHCKNRFSGRYETIMWFTKTDDYIFNLDPVRVPQKYPGKKHFKGDKKGELSCNPLGKNPTNLWTIPNVKHNHCEKTKHPCQFPVELAERLVLALTNEGDLVVDPYAGVASSLCAAILHKRLAVGCDICQEYVDIGQKRITMAIEGRLATRPMNKPIYSKENTSDC